MNVAAFFKGLLFSIPKSKLWAAGTVLRSADGREYTVGASGTWFRTDREGIRKRAERRLGLSHRQLRKMRRQERQLAKRMAA